MNLTIHSQAIEITPEEESRIKEQVNSSLKSYMDKVRSVDIYIKDVNGPRGGQDKSVVIRARIGGRTELASSALEAKLLSASASAARKTRRRVKSALRRKRQFDRHSSGGDRSSPAPMGAAH